MDFQPWHYIVLIGALVLVWSNLLSRKRKAGEQAEGKAPGAGLQGMELALEQFMENMEESQRHLTGIVVASKEQEREEAERKEARIAELEKQCRLLQQELEGQAALIASASATVVAGELTSGVPAEGNSMAATAIEATEDVEAPPAVKPGIRERFEPLFQLHEQGCSVEQIAKKLGMNKGEVMLIQQLARQEESRYEAS
ncbi:hypothetical protein [Paenibacillus herberti]|uniref:DUF2802 domain-containing protein n=1 Tax=Paenibacillus herberti TaxID=1619309 RepID=A0A229P1D8_9BACL|nr:hypothetical protein [Paenibacillus herberti]OXM16012.1 hypothetical protein CGZ75_04720 [Paenibacillus herberti]